MGSEQSRAVAEQTITAINERDRGAISRLAAEDIQLRFPPSQVFEGREGVSAFFDELERRVPNLTLAIRKVYAGDDFAVVEWLSSGSSQGGIETDSLGVVVMELADGRASRVQLYVDTAQWQTLG
jgi:ketosteroid isomerase-like protein